MEGPSESGTQTPRLGVSYEEFWQPIGGEEGEDDGDVPKP